MSQNPFPEYHPCHHTRKVMDRLSDLMDHLRRDVEKVDDPRAQALFETAAEVLGGLHNAFADYEKGDEAAWRDDQ